MFELAFLASDRGPLTKHFSLNAQGQLVASPYPHIAEFTSQSHNVTTISEFFSHLCEHAEKGDCLLKGTLTRALSCESRAGSTDRTAPTHWIVFDVDGLESVRTPAQFIKLLPTPFQTASYITQVSASMGFASGPGLRAHIFFLLDQPTLPAVLKLWLKHLNLSTPKLRSSIILTRSKATLKWPLDPSVAQNDKLVYVAAPTLGPGVSNPVSGPRLRLVERKHARVHLDLTTLPSEEAINATALETLNELRIAEGLAARPTAKMRVVQGIEVLSKPGTALVTGVKRERGFTYLNLNGGDSWGYYFPDSDPKILYNFKGEENYLLEEIAPQFHLDAVATATAEKEEAQREINENFTGALYDETRKLYFLALLNTIDDSYYRGTWDPETNALQLDATGALTKVIHFLKENGQPVPEYVPQWRLMHAFDNDTIVDIEARTINMYQRSEYMRNPRASKDLPKLCGKLIRHVFNYDEPVIEHFLNWLAYIVQYRKKTGTAWVLHGTTGTGKGVLYHNVITPILGPKYCGRTSITSFEQQFNAIAESSLILLIDESQVSDLQRRSSAVANIKQLITEPKISIRRMRTDAYVADSYLNLIFASNTYDPAQIDANDRRMNVAPRQERKLDEVLLGTDIEKLEGELHRMAGYLLNRPVDLQAVRTPIETEERTRLQRVTQDTNMEIAHAIRTGDIQFFLDERPDHDQSISFMAESGVQNPKSYDEILDECIASSGAPMNMHRDHLEALYFYLSGLTFSSRPKFSKFAGHRGLDIKKIRVGNTTAMGLYGVQWKVTPELKRQWLKLRSKP